MGKVKKRHSSYLSHLKTEIHQAADAAGIDRQESLELIDEYFVRIQHLLRDPRMPKIEVPNLGVFVTPFTSLRYNITRKIQQYRKGTYSKIDTQLAIKKLWTVYKRKVHEKFGPKDDNIKSWNYIDPLEFDIDNKSGFHTELPENYYQLRYKEWYNFLKQEARFSVHTPKNKKLSILYNSLRGRLIKIDKIEEIEKTLSAKCFETFNTKQGRRSEEEERMTKIVWAILSDQFNWDNKKIIDGGQHYDRTSIR